MILIKKRCVHLPTFPRGKRSPTYSNQQQRLLKCPLYDLSIKFSSSLTVLINCTRREQRESEGNLCAVQRKTLNLEHIPNHQEVAKCAAKCYLRSQPTSRSAGPVSYFITILARAFRLSTPRRENQFFLRSPKLAPESGKKLLETKCAVKISAALIR